MAFKDEILVDIHTSIVTLIFRVPKFATGLSLSSQPYDFSESMCMCVCGIFCAYPLVSSPTVQHFSTIVTTHPNHQDHLKKFCLLYPRTPKPPQEEANNMFEIFCTSGSPHIIQSKNAREFSNKIVKKILERWPGCKLIQGKLRRFHVGKGPWNEQIVISRSSIENQISWTV